MSKRKLIVNADDLGLTASVNRGIAESIKFGIVRSASLMVNMPGAADASERIAALLADGVRFGVGLHLNLVAGQPLTDAPTLRNERTGGFLSLAQLAWRSRFNRIRRADVQSELDAQLETARSLLPDGVSLTHIDSHRHAHCFPAVFPVVTDAARKHRIPHVRQPRESTAISPNARSLIAAGLLRLAMSSQSAVDDVEFTGISLMGSWTVEDDLIRLFERLPEGATELMMHPGFDSEELGAIDPYRAPRERELRALTSAAVMRRLEELQIELTDFSSIAAIEPRATQRARAAS